MGRTKVPANSVKRFLGRTETADQGPHRVPMITRRGAVIGLLIIMMLAATLRLVSLTQSPPGLNQDEAANAWNSYCLLKTGKDQVGVSWPIFYSRCLGGNRSTLYLYLTIPFQAIGGLNVWTTRLPCAAGGVLTVLLIYWVGATWWGRGTGLVAAALLAVNPWHLQQSRWGHEAGLGALLAIAPLAMMLWAGLPFGNGEPRRPRVFGAALAGLVTGICCYGYPAIRLFLPVFVMAALIVTWSAWWRLLKTRRGALAIGAWILCLLATAGPLLYTHLTDPEINKRAQTTRLWNEADPVGEKLKSVLARYPGHYGLDFLFAQGDHYEVFSVPGFGQFHWYMLPLMVLGLCAVLFRVRSSSAAGILLVWVIVYPVGDVLSRHMAVRGLSGLTGDALADFVGLHALRSLPGLCGLILLGATGGMFAGRWLWRKQRVCFLAAATLMAFATVGMNVRFLTTYFGDYNRRTLVYHSYHTDLVQACEWLKPRLDTIDAVFCTVSGMNRPYIVTLVALGHEPEDWFTDDLDMHMPNQWDTYTRYGRIHFMHRSSRYRDTLTALKANDQRDRVIYITRPSKFEEGVSPLHQIRRPDGRVVLWIIEKYL